MSCGPRTQTRNQARCMHAVCKEEQKRVSAGQKKSHLRPEFVQASPQCAGGLGVAKNSQRGLDHLRRRRLPGWSVLTADDRLPSLGRDCGGRKFSLPARLRGVTHHLTYKSRCPACAESPCLRAIPSVLFNGRRAGRRPLLKARPPGCRGRPGCREPD